MLSCVTCGQNDEFTEKSEEKNSFPSERPCWRAIPGFAGFNVCIFCQTRIWKSAFQSWRLMPNLYWNLSNLKTVEIWRRKNAETLFCVCFCICVYLQLCLYFPQLPLISMIGIFVTLLSATGGKPQDFLLLWKIKGQIENRSTWWGQTINIPNYENEPLIAVKRDDLQHENKSLGARWALTSSPDGRTLDKPPNGPPDGPPNRPPDGPPDGTLCGPPVLFGNGGRDGGRRQF